MHAQLLEQLSPKQTVSQTDNFRETGINNAQTHDFQGLSQSELHWTTKDFFPLVDIGFSRSVYANKEYEHTIVDWESLFLAKLQRLTSSYTTYMVHPFPEERTPKGLDFRDSTYVTTYFSSLTADQYCLPSSFEFSLTGFYYNRLTYSKKLQAHFSLYGQHISPHISAGWLLRTSPIWASNGNSIAFETSSYVQLHSQEVINAPSLSGKLSTSYTYEHFFHTQIGAHLWTFNLRLEFSNFKTDFAYHTISGFYGAMNIHYFGETKKYATKLLKFKKPCDFSPPR